MGMKKMKCALAVIVLCIILLVAVFAYVFTLPKYPKFPASKYDELLHRLASGNYSYILIHDCDFQIDGLKTLLAVEKIYNVRSTCYVRPETEYLSWSISYLRQIEREGWKIGFHYDCLSRSNNSLELALELFKAQLSYLRCFFNITSTHYHGDGYNFYISNKLLYNETLWRELGLTEISERTIDWSYITDVNGTWREPANLTRNVFVNLHSDWW
jgi:hypothetical protein